MRRYLAMTVAVVGLALGAFVATASADPLNSLTATFTFSCTGGLQFSAVGISQNNNTTGHIVSSNDSSLSANAIYQVKRIVFDGTVVRDLNGFSGRTLLSCQIVAIDGVPFTSNVVLFQGFLTPNS